MNAILLLCNGVPPTIPLAPPRLRGIGTWSKVSCLLRFTPYLSLSSLSKPASFSLYPVGIGWLNLMEYFVSGIGTLRVSERFSSQKNNAKEKKLGSYKTTNCRRDCPSEPYSTFRRQRESLIYN